jgi:hypothetical protein
MNQVAANIIVSMRYALIVMILSCLMGFGATPKAGDVSGQWVAQIKNMYGDVTETTFDFKASGEKLTGSMTSQFGERQISDGKISGDDITFLLHIEFERNQINYRYKGKVSGNEIKFTRERLRGATSYVDGEFVAKRKAS